MKFLKYFLIIICSVNLFLLAAEEEEIKTIEIDGIIYKINPGSLNITTMDDNAVVKEVEKLDASTSKVETSTETNNQKETTIDVFFNAGQLFPINNTDNLDSGTGFGFSVNLPKTISLFEKEFATSVEFNSVSLSGIQPSDDDNTLTSVVGHLSTSASFLDLL